MSLPYITNDELIIYHIEQTPNVAVQEYMRRNNIDVKTADLHMIHEQFQWEWQHRLYADELE